MKPNYNLPGLAVQGEFPETRWLGISFLPLANSDFPSFFRLELEIRIWNVTGPEPAGDSFMKAREFVLLFLVSLFPIGAFAQNVNDDLIAAAKRGDAAAVKSLLAKGADVNAKTRYSQTPLMFAAQQGHFEIVKTLLEAGADVNVTDTFYKSVTAVSAAAEKGHAEIVKLLLEKCAKSKETALYVGAQQGHAPVVKAALDMGGLSQETLDRALGFVNEAESKEIAEALKKAGAKPLEKKQLKPEVKVDDPTLQKYAGTYRLDEARQYTFIVKDGKLGGWDVRQYSFPLTAIDRNVFRIGNSDDRTITFNEENGKIVSITVTQTGFKQNYNRV